MYRRALVIAGLATLLFSCGRQAVVQKAATESTPHNVPVDFVVIIFGDASPDTGPAPLSVEFTVEDPLHGFIDPKYHWDFGDGSPPSDKRAPTHVYQHPGKYKAKITVTDSGKGDSDTVEIVVK